MQQTTRKTITSLAAAWAIALPPVSASAAIHGTSASGLGQATVVTSFNGPAVQCKRWGKLQVRIKVRKTTTTVNGKRKVAVRIIGITFPVKPHYTAKTLYINKQALPLLVQQALATQHPEVEVITGATDTTDSFTASLQAAILKAYK